MSENVYFKEQDEQKSYTERQIQAAEKQLGLTGERVVPRDEPWRKRFIEHTGGYEARLNPQQPTQQPNPPGWDQLSNTERYLYQKVFPSKPVQWLGEKAEYINDNLPWLAKGIGFVGKAVSVLDVFAEATERGVGMVAQYEEARKYGRTDEFFDELGAAWKAASMYYDVSNFFTPGELEDGRLTFYNDMPGYEELYDLRQKILDGKTRQEIHEELTQDLGPLALRSAMTDAMGHILADPGNILLPMVTKLPSRFILKRGEILHRAGAYTDEVVDAARIAEKAAFEAMDAARVAGRPLDESAGLVTDAIRASEYLAELEGKALSPWEKFVVGVTGGFPQSLEKAGEWVAKGPKGTAKLLPWNWFRLTPQTRAVEVLENVSMHVQQLLGKGNYSVDEMIDLVRAVAKGADHPSLAHMVASPSGRAVQSWLRGAEASVDDLARFWEKSAVRRGNLEAMARVLSGATEGEYDIHRVVDKLIHGEHADVWNDLAKALDDGPIEGLEVYHDILRTMRAEGSLDQTLLEAYGKVFKDMPYNQDTFQLHLMGQLWEWTAKQATTKYGLEAAGFFRKASEALKSVESLIFLRANAKYPIINFLNNEVTGIARGVWNMMSSEDVISFWKRVGVVHPRLMSGIGMAGIGGVRGGISRAGDEAFDSLLRAYDDASKIIGNASKMSDGWLGQFADKIKNIKLPVDGGDFAQRIERSASMRFMTQGMVEGMNWYWRPSRGYDLVNDFDPTLAERLGDDLTRQIHKTIQSNPYDFAGKMTENVALNKTAQEVLEEATQSMGIPLERVDEVFGAEMTERIRDVLNPALQSGNKDTVRSAIITIRQDVTNHIDDWVRAVDPGEALLDGQLGVHRVYGEIQAQYWDMFEGHLKLLDERIPNIRAKTGDELEMAWDTLMRETDAGWNRFFDWRKKRYKGMTAAMEEQGLASVTFEDGRTFSQVIDDTLAGETDVIHGYHQLKRRRFRAHRKKQLEGHFEHPNHEANSWAKLQRELGDEYQNVIKAQDETQKFLDDVIEQTLPPGQRDAFHNYRLVLRRARREYSEWNAKFYREAEGLTGAARRAFFEQDYHNIRSQRINDLHTMERLGLQAMAGDEQAAAELTRMSDGILAQIEDQLKMGGMADEIAEDVGFKGRWFTSDLDDAKNYIKLKQDAGLAEVEITYVDIPDDELAQHNVRNFDEALQVSLKPEIEYVPPRDLVSTRQVWEEGIPDPEEGVTRLYRSASPKEREFFDVTPGTTPDRPFFIDQRVIYKDQPPMAQTSNAVYYGEGGTILDHMEDAAVNIAGRRSVTMGDLDEADQAKLLKYIDHIQGQSQGTQLAAMNYAAARRDSALLNYTRRTELDAAVNTIAPYAFWPMHSMWNWGLWSLERPAVLANYMRLKRLFNTPVGSREIPQRLRGYAEVPIKLPFWEDWMGEGVLINPLKIGLPMETFSYPFERYYQSAVSTERATARALEDMLANEEISLSEYNTAVQDRSGPIWGMARRQAKQSGDDDSWFDFGSMLVSPHAPLQWAYRAAFKPDDPVLPTVTMPMTRDIKSITGYLGIGPPGGVNIEGGIRKTLGLPEFDEWDDYRVDRMLSNMAATNEATAAEAMQAMIARSGPLFEEATRRASKEYGLRGSFGIVGVPVNAYPPGEEKARELYNQFGDVIQAYNNGDYEAYKEFFEEYPEAKVRLALFDKPEERLRNFVVDELWSTYNEMPDLHKKQMAEALGEDFQTYFLGGNRDTYSQMPIEVLQGWARMANGEMPGAFTGDAVPLEYSDLETAQQMQVFYDTRRQYFGDEIWDIQGNYFKMQKGRGRDAYLAKYPELKEYWDWRRDFMYRNPGLAPYIEENPDRWPKYSDVEEMERLSQMPNFTLGEWQVHLGYPLYNLLVDDINGTYELPETALSLLDRKAATLGLSDGGDIFDAVSSLSTP